MLKDTFLFSLVDPYLWFLLLYSWQAGWLAPYLANSPLSSHGRAHISRREEKQSCITYLPFNHHYKLNGWLSKEQTWILQWNPAQTFSLMPWATRRIPTWLDYSYYSAFSTCCGVGFEPKAKARTLLWTSNRCVSSLLPCLVKSVTMMFCAVRRNCRWSCSEAPLVDTNGWTGSWLTWKVGITKIALAYVCAPFSV